MTAYRSLQELDILIDLSDSTALQAIKEAQMEQALWEIKYDTNGQGATGVSIGGLLSATFPTGESKPARYSPRALAMLRPYLRGRTVTRTR